jgi:hypothetical protein
MKKILFICPRNPFSERFSGDVIRAKKFIYFLSKNNYVKVLSPDLKDTRKKESKLSYEGFKEISFVAKIYHIFFSLLKAQPMQLGYFFSPRIKEYTKNNYQNYDIIFFQSFRTVQYLPENFKKKSILDMGDLMSKNYRQTSAQYFFLNPIKIVYFIESLLVKQYEDLCFSRFNKILLLSKKEVNSVEKKYKRKLAQISFGINHIKKKYKFHEKNYKIVFIGNINYVPNKNACYEFSNKILPIINKIHSNIEFHIIGEISKIDHFLLSKKKNVKILNKIKNIEPYLDQTICGLANLRISTGVQTKLLTYMSYGIPSVCSKQVSQNFDGIKEAKVSYYNNNKELIKIILKFKRNQNFSLSASKRSLKMIKKFKWEKILPVLNKFL